MSTIRFWGFLAILLVASLAYPLYQLATTGGYVYYTNGYDESTYLQYDFSRAVQALTRPGQYLVSKLHEAGLSGGMINLVLDAAGLVLFALFALGLFMRLGWSARRARLGAMLLLLLPQALMTVNPVMHALYRLNVKTRAVYWINLPELNTPALLRTPEPQVSLILLAAAALVALRLRSFWPAYLVLPFMYPFVAIPAAFVLLALHLRSYWRWRAAAAGPLALSALAIGVAAWAYYTLMVGEKIRVLLVDSHLPLVSVTGLVALGTYLAFRRQIAEPLRFFALAVALAPLVASNQQVISGHLAQPDNFEQYAGCFAVALVAALVERPHLQRAAVALGGALFLWGAAVVFSDNHRLHARLPLSPALVAALAEDPGHTAVNDVWLASHLALVHPRQGSTAFGFEKTFPALAGCYVGEYRCLKRRVLADHPEDAGFRRTLAFLDAGYAYGSQNYLMVHIYRKTRFTRLQGVSARDCAEAEPPALRYFRAAPER